MAHLFSRDITTDEIVEIPVSICSWASARGISPSTCDKSLREKRHPILGGRYMLGRDAKKLRDLPVMIAPSDMVYDVSFTEVDMLGRIGKQYAVESATTAELDWVMDYGMLKARRDLALVVSRGMLDQELVIPSSSGSYRFTARLPKTRSEAVVDFRIDTQTFFKVRDIRRNNVYPDGTISHVLAWLCAIQSSYAGYLSEWHRRIYNVRIGVPVTVEGLEIEKFKLKKAA